jgi:N-acetylmuramic acid 6-phosphate etherase
MSAKSKALDFLLIAPQFQLGHLVTEGIHPMTKNLSQVVNHDIAEALALLQTVDRDALKLMEDKSDLIWQMSQDIQETLNAGHKIFMCGCGATGRLSLVLETLFHQKYPGKNKVVSFMAGGDYALIKSVESFEDKVEYGERQLMELGFTENDLLLSPTEGGETPFVIGATNLAARFSKRSPYFLYCNPDESLFSVQRSKEVIENPSIHKVNLTVGPMAISGSTRMQASTVLMLAIGMGLLYEHENKKNFELFYKDFLKRLTATDYKVMEGLTKLEASLYQEKKYLNYIADPHLAISILTDTTERSPTFSLSGFENRLNPESTHSLSYLFIADAETTAHGWSQLLWRSPRALEWSELDGSIGLEKVFGFDISKQGQRIRSSNVNAVNFEVLYDQGQIKFICQDEHVEFNWGEDQLFNHLMVKMLLNAHSTLIMGLLGRYEGNVMTWVRPSNNKLIDRAARYILHLLNEAGKSATYEDVVEKIFEEREGLMENEPIVLKVLKRY